MTQLRRRVPAALLSLLVIYPGLTSTEAHASAGWLNDCPYSHSLKDDPIVFPRQPGASHLHDFFGAEHTNAGSTLRSMRHRGTTCQKHDTSGYWVPALFEAGRRILPSKHGVREEFYYRDDNLRAGTHVTPFPPGMKLLTGDAHAMSVNDNPELGEELYWGCSDNHPGGKFTHPISCASGIISLHVGFPNCWDGKHLSMAASPNAVVYPEDGRCPGSHPVELPRLIERYEYPVGTRSDHIRLSSGAPYTVHGDFWNTWNQRALRRLVNRCLNRDRNCGTFPRD